MRDVLERRYQRLLFAYPARYRRVRGLEMLTTLMDMAPDGRTRPSFGDAVSLVFGGLRCRLSPRGAPVSVGVFAAVFTAVLGAIGGALAGWQIADPGLPSDAAAVALARTADPGLPGSPSDRRDFLFGYDIPVQENEKVLVALLGGDEYTAGYVQFTKEHDNDNLASLRAARARLEAAGWQVNPLREQPWGGEFTAQRGELLVHMATQGGDQSNETSLWVKRATPILVPILTVLGLLLGAVVGWQLGGWAGRRNAAQPPIRRTLATAAFLLGSVLMVPPTIFNLIALAGSLWTTEPTPIWIGYVFILMRGFALLGSASLITALLIAALPHSRVLART